MTRGGSASAEGARGEAVCAWGGGHQGGETPAQAPDTSPTPAGSYTFPHHSLRTCRFCELTLAISLMVPRARLLVMVLPDV